MRKTRETLDEEVLRHYVGMRDNLTGFLDIWLSLDQLMHTEGLTHHDEISDESWMYSASLAMTALEALVDIVTNSPDPTPVHWLRWRVETAFIIKGLNERLDLLIGKPLRP